MVLRKLSRNLEFSYKAFSFAIKPIALSSAPLLYTNTALQNYHTLRSRRVATTFCHHS